MEKEEKVTEEIKDINTEEKSENVDKKTIKQVSWFFGLLVLLLIALFAGAWVSHESQKFDYIGLTFQKEKFGEIPIYTSQITGYGVNGLPMNFKLVLRNDPT
ncbi:MAG: hypothetical protein AABX03_04475, partial [Nanoarchaeota archaeon]